MVLPGIAMCQQIRKDSMKQNMTLDVGLLPERGVGTTNYTKHMRNMKVVNRDLKQKVP